VKDVVFWCWQRDPKCLHLGVIKLSVINVFIQYSFVNLMSMPQIASTMICTKRSQKLAGERNRTFVTLNTATVTPKEENPRS